MPTPNPKYNPDWEAIHDRHNAERARIGEEMETLTQQDQKLFDAGQTDDSAERLAIFRAKERLRAEWDEHHQACLESFQMQHSTIQEYAAWVFEHFDPAMNAPGATVPAIDFEKFTTIEDVGSAWRQANKTVEVETQDSRAGRTLQKRPNEIKHKFS